MTPIRLELSLQCVACHAPIALNAVAPSVVCGGCGRKVSLGVERWRELLRAPLEEVGSMREGEQRDASFESPEGVCRRVYRREPLRCVACASPVAEAASTAAARPSGWVGCGQCHRSILARALPTIAPGVACFVGEDAELAFGRGQQQKEPVAVACPGCGGNIPADGAERVFACKYCHATVHLPDEVWARLHPTRPVQAFWALVATAAAPHVHEAPCYGAVRAAALDAAGNVYLAAENAVYSLDAHMNPRWVRTDIHVTERMFMLWPDGRIWVHGRTSPVILSCEDGHTLGPGPPFPSAEFTTYAVQGASVIVSLHSPIETPASRVRRMSLDGGQLELFKEPAAPAPKKKSFFEQLLASPSPAPLPGSIEQQYGIRIFGGQDGDLLEIGYLDWDMYVALRAATGEQRWRFLWPCDLVWFRDSGLFPERGGTVLMHVPKRRTLVRVSATGLRQVLPAERAEQLIGPSTCVLPTRDGEILLFGDHGDIVRLAPDGREVWSNEAARSLERARVVAAQRN